jgi:hypothetical protein
LQSELFIAKPVPIISDEEMSVYFLHALSSLSELLKRSVRPSDCDHVTPQEALNVLVLNPILEN